MKNQNPDPAIESRLEDLKSAPPRNPQRAARGRARFLSEAAKYQQAVSPAKHLRQRMWIFPIRKEKFVMNALVSIILAAAMVLGGGTTAVAAQDDLPNQPLYPVKLWTENAKLALTGDPVAKASLLMDMSQTRVEEMAALAQMGITPPRQVQTRLEQQIRQTLNVIGTMDDATFLQTMTKLREHLQTQEQVMAQLQDQANPETAALLLQTRQMLQSRLQLVDQGLADPQGFRYTITNQMQYSQEEEAEPEPNQQGEPGFHQNGQSEQTPEKPRNGYQDGNDSGNSTPGGQDANGTGSGNNNGQGGNR